MLANILAIVVGLGSVYLLSTAFIAADRHRQDDFLWSAVGLFYALVLWLCAGRFTGAILLGQAAASGLILVFGWQTLKLRRALLYPDHPVLLFSLVDWLGERLGQVASLQQPLTPSERAPATPLARVPENAAGSTEGTGSMPGALDGEDEVLFDELADDPEEDDNVTEAGSPTVACEEEGDDTETSLPITVPFHSPPEKSVSSPETPENPPAQN